MSISLPNILRTVSAVAALSTASALLVVVAPDALPAIGSEYSSRVVDRPDRVSAMVAARSQGSRVEDVSARTPTTATFANGDGTWTTEAYAGVVRSQDDSGTWVAVDPDVRHQGDRYTQEATPVGAEFSDGGDRSLGSITTAGNDTVRVGWPTKLPAPSASGNELTYTAATTDGSDLVVTSMSDGFESSIMLDHPPAADTPVEYRIPVDVGTLDVSARPDGAVVLSDGKNPVAVFGAPMMWDANNASADGDRRPVEVSLEGSGSSRTLVLKPDMSFLTAPSTAYPVTVDPPLTMAVAGDTWVDNVTNTASQQTSTELRVGSTNIGITKARSYLQFDYSALSSIPAVDHVVSAQLQVSNFQTGNCTGTAVRMSRVTGPWTVGGLTWGTQPAITSLGSSTSSESHGASSCTAEGTMTFDATAIAQAWAGGQAQFGVQLAADNEGASSGFRKLRSLENGDLAKVPKFTMTYGANPSTPTDLTVSPGYSGYATSKTPKLSAVVTDPDGGAVSGYFEVKSGSTLVWSGTSAPTTSGGRVSVTVPAGALNESATYAVQVWGDDGALRSAAGTSARTFAVDTIAPTVTMTSNQFSNGAWLSGMPSTSTFSYDGSPDTAGFYTTFDGVDLPAVSANSSGDYSGTYKPTPGWHVATVAAIDKAGNRSAAVTFAFGTGEAGFSAPNEWAQGASSFPISASAPPSATGAALSWRYAGETTWRLATQATDGSSTWTGAVNQSSGRSSTPELVWNATSETVGSGRLHAPALLQIRTCFQYASRTDSCSAARLVSLNASALDTNSPHADLGPVEVALATGEATVTEPDAADYKAGIQRLFRSYSNETLAVGGLFGPGWSDPYILAPVTSDAVSRVTDNRAQDGSFIVVGPDSGSQTFVKKAGSSTLYVPLQPTGDDTHLTFVAGTGGSPDRLSLSRPSGTDPMITNWELDPSDTGGEPIWDVVDVDAPGTADDLSVTRTGQRPTWIRESDPSASATCSAATQTAGCRGIRIHYVGTGTSMRVSDIESVVGAASPSNVASKTLTTYNYDGSGRLASACSAAPAVGKPSLCTGYGYVTVSGRTLLAQIVPPGLKPWRLNYDAAGRLSSVKRERPAGGDSTWSVDYSLSVGNPGLPDMSATAIGQWGQAVLPTKVYAVTEPTNGTADVTDATLYYTGADGLLVNTATYGPAGWLVDTTWTDGLGNELRHLDKTGWSRVQSAPPSVRVQVAADASSYKVYNGSWGDPGTRLVDEYGPARSATLKNGTVGTYRPHTRTTYDDDPAVDPALIADRPTTAGLGLAVKQITSASDAAMTTDFDQVVTKFGYAPIVSGDGDGWGLGSPTSTSRQVDASTWSTGITRFNQSGQPIEVRQAGGGADGSGAGNDAHSTVTTYYSASGAGECGGHPEWAGLACKVGPSAQPSGTSIPTTYYASYNSDLQPLIIEEWASGVVARSTTMEYDSLDRITSVTKETTGPDVRHDSIAKAMSYDAATGLPTTVTADGSATSTGYDSWGRVVSYTDSLGTEATTTYDNSGNLVSYDDGDSQYDYVRDAHGLLTGVDAGGGVGSFGYTYTASGALGSVSYPNGIVASRTYNEVDDVVGLSYRQGSESLLAFSQVMAADSRIVARSSTGSSQAFKFDDLGRLATAEDRQASGCTTRVYGFDASSDRTAMTAYGPDASTGGCQAATVSVARPASFDASGRRRNAGYTYDTLGRTLTVPFGDTVASASTDLLATYGADDMVASLTQSYSNTSGGQDSKSILYRTDPSGRISSATTSTNATEVSRERDRYPSGAGDSPSVIETSTNGGASWVATRYVSLPDVGLVASTTSGETTIQLSNAAGDIVATVSNAAGSNALASFTEADEFGNRPLGAAPQRYGWLGSHQRSADAVGGIMLMGARLYNPTTGSFLSMDPVVNASATPYTYPLDPINDSDPTGRESEKARDERARRELVVCLSFGAAKCAEIVYITLRVEKHETHDGNRGNFIRHFMWQTLLASWIGYHAAVAVGNAHEYHLAITGTPWQKADSWRDLMNNESARRFFRKYGGVSRAYDAPEYMNDVLETEWNVGNILWGRGYGVAVCGTESNPRHCDNPYDN